MKTKIDPIHPGEVLLEDFLSPMGLSQHELALRIGVEAGQIDEIVQGQRAVTADTALRLGRFFGTSAEFWMNLQTRYDLERLRDASWERIEREVEVLEPTR